VRRALLLLCFILFCFVFLEGGEEDVQLKVEQGAHPDPFERFARGFHTRHLLHKGIVCPAQVHVHCILEGAGDEGRRVEGLHVKKNAADKV
jgi:hypothetical protein